MKTMTCNQLGGACDVEFKAETFEEMANQAQQHGKEMFEAQDAVHLKVMGEMAVLMQDPAKMQEWFDGKRAEFDALPNSN